MAEKNEGSGGIRERVVLAPVTEKKRIAPTYGGFRDAFSKAPNARSS